MKILEVKTELRKIGDLGEKLAKKHLKRNGYRILEENYVALGNEIDIIAENKKTLAFIEVKTRSFGKDSLVESRPAAAVTKEKQRKIIKAAKYYSMGSENKKELRFDVIEVIVDNGNQKQINHMEGAFNINTAFRTGKS